MGKREGTEGRETEKERKEERVCRKEVLEVE